MKPIFRVTDFGAIPNSEEIQTASFQAALDAARDGGGGKVVVPRGSFTVGGLRLYSDTTLYLESGAVLLGSEEKGDYPIFPLPEGITLHSDMELLHEYYAEMGIDACTYRRAILSAYGEKNISVIGEKGARIDGRDCYDHKGEEGFRGPHGIFFSSCENLYFSGYTIENAANFAHQLDTCRNVLVEEVTVLGGHDGFHIHYSENVKVCRSVIAVGDDCFAGINYKGLTVEDCQLNTACNALRLGGSDTLFCRCVLRGPSVYPHRLSVVLQRGTPEGKGKSLARTEGKHDTWTLVSFFGTEASRTPGGSCRNAVFRDMEIECIGTLFDYSYASSSIMKGNPISDITLERVSVKGLSRTPILHAPSDAPLLLTLKDVRFDFADGIDRPLLDGSEENVLVSFGK